MIAEARLLSAKVIARLREQLLRALPDDSPDGTTEQWSRVYVPPAHAAALSLNRMVVEGMRGCGKTFWTGILADDVLRGNLEKSANDFELAQDLRHLHRVIAFRLDQASGELNPQFPGPAAVSKLLADPSVDALAVWSVAVLRQFDIDPALGLPAAADPFDPWTTQLRWATEHADRIERAMELLDERLTAESRTTLILVDALDCVAQGFEAVAKMASGLLRLMVRFRFARSLRFKAFVREDILSRAAPSVVDGAKLLNNKVNLNWTQTNLYGLLFHTFAQDSAAFRNRYETVTKVAWRSLDSRLSASNVETVLDQQQMWNDLVGPYMGKTVKRGHSYPYVFNHLADGLGRVAPRSFLAAVRYALLQTGELYSDCEWVIHHEAIKDGVRRASRNRIQELATEYAWVSPALEALKLAKLTVPVPLDEARRVWMQDSAQGPIEGTRNTAVIPWSQTDPCVHRVQSMIDTMVQIGVLKFRSSGSQQRLELPDIYRLGYKIGRKGGIATEQKASSKP
jgi:hypothetical protein